MEWTIKEFKINKLKARIRKLLHGMKIVNFYYGDDFRKVPNIRAYGGMRVVKGKFGNYFELDLKDDDTEKFFKILGEQLQCLPGAYFDKKPWNLKSLIVEYGIFYSICCKIPQNFNKLKVGEYFRGYCEIRPYHAFSGKTKGITFTLNKVLHRVGTPQAEVLL